MWWKRGKTSTHAQYSQVLLMVFLSGQKWLSPIYTLIHLLGKPSPAVFPVLALPPLAPRCFFVFYLLSPSEGLEKLLWVCNQFPSRLFVTGHQCVYSTCIVLCVCSHACTVWSYCKVPKQQSGLLEPRNSWWGSVMPCIKDKNPKWDSALKALFM